MTILTGWGRHPSVRAEGTSLRTSTAPLHPQAGLPRGLGRSYGDVSLPAPGVRYIDTRFLDRFLSFDAETGILESEAGVSLRAIIDALLPRGWFLPVTPGTQWVTLGGAVASNVHGKNHHHCGSIEHFVEQLEVTTPGGVLRCSPRENTELFRATVGGYGLTGLITRVRLRMKRVASSLIRARGLRRPDLARLFEAFREHDAGCEYSVAWIDTLARGQGIGRGVLLLGNHVDTVDAEQVTAPGIGSPGKGTPRSSRHTLFDIPFPAPAGILQPWALRAFNAAYYHLPRSGNVKTTNYESFFYPLDIIGNWNRMYGPRGFFQYQCVIPDPDGQGQGEAGVEACLRFLARHGMGSFRYVSGEMRQLASII